jgi:hypothetical protein
MIIGKDQTLTRERFTIAHELGHILVDRAKGAQPSTEAEYWKHEDMCNRFAGALLVPTAALKPRTTTKDPAAALLSELWRVSAQCAVSQEVAARRLVEQCVLATLLMVQHVTNSKGSAVLKVRWVASSDPEVSFARRQNIFGTHPIGRAVSQGKKTFGLETPPRLGAAVFNSFVTLALSARQGAALFP